MDHLQALPSQLEQRIEVLKIELLRGDPHEIAQRSGIQYLESNPGQGGMHISFLGIPYCLTWPGLEFSASTSEFVAPVIQALFLYYLPTSDGTLLIGEWVSFADLPGGRIYDPAFQGYTGKELVRAFGRNINSFGSACVAAGGVQIQVADDAYRFQALPRLPLLAAYWLGDEDFASSCRILFDHSVSHYLPIDACAVLGSLLTRRILSIQQ